MPPKKKRGGQNQITLAVAKMSTRYGKKSDPNKIISDAEISKTMPKTVGAKKGKARAKKASTKPAMNKSEVSFIETNATETVESALTEVEPPVSEVPEIIEIGKNMENVEPEIDPIEKPYSQENNGESMETSEVKNADAATCEITEQLEGLNVEEEVQEEPLEVDPVQREVAELDNNYEDIAVEYITEEFVPVGDSTEVVIDEIIAKVEEDINLAGEHAKVEVNEESKIEASSDVKEEIKKESTSQVDSIKEEEPDLKVSPKPKLKKKVTKKEPKQKPPPKKKPPSKPKPKKDLNQDEVRRSSRIKSINQNQKQRSKGHGLVKQPETAETQNSILTEIEKGSCTDLTSISSIPIDNDNKPVKVKSRWRRSSELEMNVLTPAAVVMETSGDSEKIAEANALIAKQNDVEEVEKRLKQFVHLKENLYLTDRMTCKEAKKMTCDCFLTSEEIDRGEWGCGEDCLNRLLMIECGSLCPVGDKCTNKKFQKSQFAPVEVFKTEKKGLGLRAAANIPYGEFILEYVGEVLDHEEFDVRADDYSNDQNRHYYFMSLRADAIIDATMKGNISRFINHSCDPNAETQKWTVNGELRIGFFSTRMILAGEEITFDYRFQRYGKEAQKCYCDAPTCRGWLGEEPDDDEDDDEEDDDEEVESEGQAKPSEVGEDSGEKTETEAQVVKPAEAVKPMPKEKKKRSPRKKPRKDIFEDLDQLDDEIDMLVTTGLKNQAHTLKLSRLMVRAKEPAQRTKLLRILRRGELPCRRLFLDYHGLRLMHGYMTDAQHLAKTDKKYESLRLEMLQTLATLPIPNKTMLQDSKVLPTVEEWSTSKVEDLPINSESSSPQDPTQTPIEEVKVKEETPSEEPPQAPSIDEEHPQQQEQSEKVETMEIDKPQNLADEVSDILEEKPPSIPKPVETKPPDVPNYEEEITALALKLLEEWSNLKEVFKIPKKERIEQMKEHEREANRGYIAGLGLEKDSEQKNESRYRILKRYRSLDKAGENSLRKSIKLEDRNIVNFPKLGKFERRKMFALQVEQREEERRRKQREMWRQHEQACILIGTDPRLTAPFDPSRGYQCIWNPQIGQWQNYAIQNPIFNPQNANVATLPGMGLQPPTPNYPPYLHGGNIIQPPILPNLPYQEEAKKEEDVTQVKFMGPIPPPVKLPPKWKTAKDKYGRPYYYHVKIRKSQWEPPPLSQIHEDPDDLSESTSSSDTSSLSSDTSSDESETDDDLDDSKLLTQVRKQLEKQQSKTKVSPIKDEDMPSPMETEENEDDKGKKEKEESENTEQASDEGESKEASLSVEDRLKDMFKDEKPIASNNKKRRAGLVSEIIISPRTEEDRLQFREDLKRYKLNKEKLKREKELILQQSKKHAKDKHHKATIKLKMREMADCNTEAAKKIKESFRSSMATVVVSVLNAYRKPDCKEGRITNTDDFKHLARKLTHFVMLKEMKHIEKIEDLVCTENVKTKAKEYIRKYMSKFGENYQKRNDEPDF